MYRIRGLQFRQHVDICANQLLVDIELDVFAFVLNANKSIEPAALESSRNFLADDVFEILVFARNFDMNIEVTMVHTFNLNQHRQVRDLGTSGAKARHAVDHEVTS